jgi:hypothetical protein
LYARAISIAMLWCWIIGRANWTSNSDIARLGDSHISSALSKVDVILVADGRGDEVGSADEIALKTGARTSRS